MRRRWRGAGASWMPVERVCAGGSRAETADGHAARGARGYGDVGREHFAVQVQRERVKSRMQMTEFVTGGGCGTRTW